MEIFKQQNCTTTKHIAVVLAVTGVAIALSACSEG